MSILGLLQKGQISCSNLEKVADMLLTPARAIWANKKVEILNGNINFSHSYNIEDKYGISLNQLHFNWNERRYWSRGFLVPFVTAPIFLLMSVVALPLLPVGLIVKKMSFENCKKAKQYHNLIEAISSGERN